MRHTCNSVSYCLMKWVGYGQHGQYAESSKDHDWHFNDVDPSGLEFSSSWIKGRRAVARLCTQDCVTCSPHAKHSFLMPLVFQFSALAVWGLSAGQVHWDSSRKSRLQTQTLRLASFIFRQMTSLLYMHDLLFRVERTWELHKFMFLL